MEKYHTDQATGVEGINVTYATEDEAGILQIDVGAPLFYASGVSLSEKGEMVMYYKQLIRSDKFEFVCTVES
ncbi:MAG: UTRA domain-containing protein [Erysipelotrichaceae bacterium]|nr:UTRA domain-containing protein [Erysipelotrichaceae bacterium]